MEEIEEIQNLSIQDEMNPGGIFQNLPLEILKMVLNNLPGGEIRKTRRLSRWYEKIVTELFSPLFNNFNIIDILVDNENDISDTLGRAMLKPHNKGNTLKLQFIEELTPYMNELLISYQKSIVALDLEIYGGQDFLIMPRLKFDFLESLSVVFVDIPENIKTITESLIAKHASMLKKLSVRDTFFKLIDDLNVPGLPVLDSLTLNFTNPKIAWSFFRASKYTITSLDIRDTDMNTEPPNADDFEVASVYQVPNLQSLAIAENKYGGSSTMFLCHNANNVVSLTLSYINLPSELPELPQLRELNISGNSGNHALIFSKCKESLECLVFNDISLDNYAVAMPKLTDLYIAGGNYDIKCGQFLSLNHKSLEFLYLRNMRPKEITLDDGAKMERVKKVVMMFDGNTDEDGYKYTEEDSARIAELCPNTEILILNEKNENEIKELVISHHRGRGFKSDLTDFFKND